MILYLFLSPNDPVLSGNSEGLRGDTNPHT